MGADGWVFVTLHFSGPVTRRDPASWRHVVATADWINHGILSYEELTVGVRTLARRGLLTKRGQGAAEVIVLTAVARKGLAAAYGARKRLGVFKLWEAGERLIAAQRERPSTVRGPAPTVYARALALYGVRPDQA